jgi:monothiol glutaredoxin
MLAAINSTARRALLQTAKRSGQHALAAAVAPLVGSAPVAVAVAAAPRRLFSSEDGESHSDFAPKYHAAKSTEKDEILKMIESHIKTYPVMLYMKGTPQAPQCGFSMQVVRILHAQGVSFDSVNVLDHPEIREGVKEYSYVPRCLCGALWLWRRCADILICLVSRSRQWPTIPQLYVKGEFVGGCDILTDMNKSGELAELLGEFKKN